jgi:hypothetical protein
MLFHAPKSTMHFFFVAPKLTRTTLALCANIHCTQFWYYTSTFPMHFFPCMHHVNFNIFHRAQLSTHTTEYTVEKKLILILMCVPTKLLCVKKYLCTPCAHYYVCAHRAKLNSACASTHNNLPRDATIYRAHWHANFFHGHSVTPIQVTSKLLFYEYSLQLNPSGPSKLSVEPNL